MTRTRPDGLPLFPTTVVGSMPRPPFVRDLLEDGDPGRAVDSAVAYVAAMQQRAGLDVISDGEWRRHSYIGVIADLATGFERGTRDGRSWHTVVEPMVARDHTVVAREVAFLKQHAGGVRVKAALPSPYLLGERMWDPERSRAAYPTRRAFTEALVPILHEALVAVVAEGVEIAQIDDPHLCLFVDERVRAGHAKPDEELEYAVDLINRVVEGVKGARLAVHLCRRNKGRAGWVGEGGYDPILPALSRLAVDLLMLEFAIPVAGDKKVLGDLPERFEIGLGCVDCRGESIETPEDIVARVEEALRFVAPERLWLHPDCGFAPGSAADIPLDEAYAKLVAEAKAAAILRGRY
jgi:5-methyltetrahydropteroyltriglutamate--homocysteine methyltransferase